MKIRATCNLLMCIVERKYTKCKFTARPDSYRTENITADDLQRPISAGENSLNGNVCSSQVRSYVFFSSIRVCERSRLSAQRISSKRWSSINTARERGRRESAQYIWKRSIFVRVSPSKNAASLTGARRLNWIDIMKTTYVYIMFLGNRDSL